MLGINEEPAYAGTISDVGPQALEDGAVSEPSLKLLDRQERLAQDVTELVVALKQKLESYQALKGMLAADEAERADIDEALEWMQRTIEDLLATVVGIEATNVK